MNPLRKVAIVGGARIPFARSNSAYTEASNQDMLTAAFKALVDKFGLKGEILGEVAAGAVIKHSRDWNLAREATLGCGLHPRTPAYDLQRACGTSLSAAIQLGHRIALGEIDIDAPLIAQHVLLNRESVTAAIDDDQVIALDLTSPR